MVRTRFSEYGQITKTAPRANTVQGPTNLFGAYNIHTYLMNGASNISHIVRELQESTRADDEMIAEHVLERRDQRNGRHFILGHSSARLCIQQPLVFIRKKLLL